MKQAQKLSTETDRLLGTLVIAVSAILYLALTWWVVSEIGLWSLDALERWICEGYCW